jgi:protein subunit release factor B
MLNTSPKIYIKHILTTQFSISNCIKIKRSSQTKFYIQSDSTRNCKKKKKKKKKKRHFWLHKIKDYNLTKQKYFECKIYICRKIIF